MKIFRASYLLIFSHLLMLFVVLYLMSENSYYLIEIFKVPSGQTGNEVAVKFVRALNNLCFFSALFSFPIVMSNYLLFRNDQPIGRKFHLYVFLLIALLLVVVFLSSSNAYMSMENVFASNWNRQNFPLLIITMFPGLIIILTFHSIKKLVL